MAVPVHDEVIHQEDVSVSVKTPDSYRSGIAGALSGSVNVRMCS